MRNGRGKRKGETGGKMRNGRGETKREKLEGR
jgi:hypothetical protein